MSEQHIDNTIVGIAKTIKQEPDLDIEQQCHSFETMDHESNLVYPVKEECDFDDTMNENSSSVEPVIEKPPCDYKLRSVPPKDQPYASYCSPYSYSQYRLNRPYSSKKSSDDDSLIAEDLSVRRKSEPRVQDAPFDYSCKPTSENRPSRYETRPKIIKNYPSYSTMNYCQRTSPYISSCKYTFPKESHNENRYRFRRNVGYGTHNHHSYQDRSRDHYYQTRPDIQQSYHGYQTNSHNYQNRSNSPHNYQNGCNSPPIYRSRQRSPSSYQYREYSPPLVYQSRQKSPPFYQHRQNSPPINQNRQRSPSSYQNRPRSPFYYHRPNSPLYQHRQISPHTYQTKSQGYGQRSSQIYQGEPIRSHTYHNRSNSPREYQNRSTDPLIFQTEVNNPEMHQNRHSHNSDIYQNTTKSHGAVQNSFSNQQTYPSKAYSQTSQTKSQDPLYAHNNSNNNESSYNRINIQPHYPYRSSINQSHYPYISTINPFQNGFNQFYQNRAASSVNQPNQNRSSANRQYPQNRSNINQQPPQSKMFNNQHSPSNRYSLSLQPSQNRSPTDHQSLQTGSSTDQQPSQSRTRNLQPPPNRTSNQPSSERTSCQQAAEERPESPNILPSKEAVLKLFTETVAECRRQTRETDRLMGTSTFSDVEWMSLTLENNYGAPPITDVLTGRRRSSQVNYSGSMGDEDIRAIQRLKDLGYAPIKATQAYLLCDRNEDAALDYLLSLSLQ